MKIAWLTTACIGIVLGSGTPAGAASVDWAQGCLPFIPPAERYYGLPPGLLQAIALTESGQDGAPYPWALNIGGQPVIAPTYQAAAPLLRRLDGTPRRDVAIGCMQIHMQYHLDKFVDPEWALHPQYNVWYAASYLDELHRRYGDWSAAVAHYHGSDPAAQRQYLCQVAAHLDATAPATGGALGLVPCRTRTPGQSRPIGATADRRKLGNTRQAIMAARRVGKIIVLRGFGE